jgi:hypothetical protein
VQYRDGLNDGTWNALGPNVRAEGTTASQVDLAGASQRFYRVLSVD